MAFRRSICTRATLLARRFNPSFAYTSHGQSDDKNRNEEPGCRNIDEFFSQRRGYGTCMSNVSRFGSLFDQQRSVLGGIGSGVIFHRYMSTSIGEGADNVDYFGDVAEVIKDAPVDAIASQLPVVSEVATAAADSAFPVAALQYVIEAVHSVTGLNWAASIALTTVLIRAATVPFLINQLKSTAKLSIMRPRLEEIKDEMTAKGNDPAAMDEGKQKMNALFREYGVTPFTPLKGLLIQGPVFISFFLAISNMAEKVPSFKTGGAFWFTDLTTPDSLYIFPVLTALTFLINVEFNMQEGMEGNPVAGTMKKFSRAVAFLTVPFTLSFPKAIFFYWVTSNAFSFVYGSVLKKPGIKKALGVPDIPVPPPSTNTQQSSPLGFSAMFKALKQASQNSAAIPAASSQPKPPTDGKATSSPQSAAASSSAVLSQRIKSLERQVKQRKKNKKR